MIESLRADALEITYPVRVGAREFVRMLGGCVCRIHVIHFVQALHIQGTCTIQICF